MKKRSTTEGDLKDALDFLAEAGAGREDNHLLAVGNCLQALGHEFHVFDAWAERAGCTCEDRKTRWDSFSGTDTDYSAILGLATNLGWCREERRKGPSAEPRPVLDILTRPLEDGADCLRDIRSLTSYEYQAGWWWAQTQAAGTWRFDTGSQRLEGHAETKGTGWWHYNGKFWAMEISNDPPTALVGEITSKRYGFAQVLLTLGEGEVGEVFGSKWRSARVRESDFWHGLRAAVEAPQPTPTLHHIAVPNGVLNLRTSELSPHSPDYQVRAVTRGLYRPGWESEAWKVVRTTFEKVFSPDILVSYLNWPDCHSRGRHRRFEA